MEGLHPPKIHHIHFKQVWNPHDESEEGLRPPRIHSVPSRLM